jgi:hypothetical protein
MPQSVPHPKPDSAFAPSFEASPWVARERVVEEPPRPPEPPVRLANEEHVIDQPLEADAIVRVRQ